MNVVNVSIFTLCLRDIDTLLCEIGICSKCWQWDVSLMVELILILCFLYNNDKLYLYVIAHVKERQRETCWWCVRCATRVRFKCWESDLEYQKKKEKRIFLSENEIYEFVVHVDAKANYSFQFNQSSSVDYSYDKVQEVKIVVSPRIFTIHLAFVWMLILFT